MTDFLLLQFSVITFITLSVYSLNYMKLLTGWSNITIDILVMYTCWKVASLAFSSLLVKHCFSLSYPGLKISVVAVKLMCP